MKEISSSRKSIIFFDRRDHYLVQIVNDMLAADTSQLQTQRRFFHQFHPRGIKEMAESKGLRIAYAVIHLLKSLEGGQISHRLSALRALRDEVVCSTNQDLQLNTGRVLIEIMKDLVRAGGNDHRQLVLAHDFRLVAMGKPRIVRLYLRKYHLLEMPEEWNQLAFDDHVHDANTKGRKSATHLIMDAWIKGIRRLRVIYYNFIRPETAAELLEAAAIMGITVRVGIEFSARFYDRFAQLIWVPRGFSDPDDFIKFLHQPSVRELMDEGRRVSEYQRRHVMAMLENFNRHHRLAVNRDLGIDLAPLDPADFSRFVGLGQASLLHLAKFIHTRLLPLMQERVRNLRDLYPAADEDERRRMRVIVNRMDELDTDIIHDLFLEPGDNPDVPDISRPSELEKMPAMMGLFPCELVDHLSVLHSGYRITLNLTNMRAEDVLEMLYDCGGRITRLEIFNLKDYAGGKLDQVPQIAGLQAAINSGNVIQLKKMTLEMIDGLRLSPNPVDRARVDKFRTILADLETFKNMYTVRPLKPRVGSDSTGQSPRLHGMGLVVMDSLPRRAQKAVREEKESPRLTIPFHVDTELHLKYTQGGDAEKMFPRVLQLIRMIPGLGYAGMQCRKEWYARENSTRMVDRGNVVTLGGLQPVSPNRLSLGKSAAETERKFRAWRYLHTRLKNSLKIAFGFIPAFLTFFLTYDWWVLAFFGAFIWFGITGLRNVLQSVLGGGGVRRSPLIRWNDYISWDRLSDSLMYTGFSVPLLDYFIKTLLLKQGLGVTVSTHPVVLYAIMALANGIYLTSHNLYRGLPPEAAFANFFRSIFSIPVAFAFNEAAGGILLLAGAADAAGILQQWAAVISKAASDFVAGFIEGTVDRARNIRHRISDYRNRIKAFIDIYARLEMLFPEKDVTELLQKPEQWLDSASEEARQTLNMLIITMLDLLYFWMYQPRAWTALNKILCGMTPDERRLLLKAHSVLKLERHISLMFIDGMLGKSFSKPLAFYLNRSTQYIAELNRLSDDISGCPEDACR